MDAVPAQPNPQSTNPEDSNVRMASDSFEMEVSIIIWGESARPGRDEMDGRLCFIPTVVNHVTVGGGRKR